MKKSSRSKASANSGAASPDIRPAKRVAEGAHAAQWTFLSNHAHVLIVLARDSSRVLREVAQEVGITERAVQRIIVDLEEAGVLVRERTGRQNHYQINRSRPLRHPVESHRSIADLIRLGEVDSD